MAPSLLPQQDGALSPDERSITTASPGPVLPLGPWRQGVGTLQAEHPPEETIGKCPRGDPPKGSVLSRRICVAAGGAVLWNVTAAMAGFLTEPQTQPGHSVNVRKGPRAWRPSAVGAGDTLTWPINNRCTLQPLLEARVAGLTSVEGGRANRHCAVKRTQPVTQPGVRAQAPTSLTTQPHLLHNRESRVCTSLCACVQYTCVRACVQVCVPLCA